MSVSGVITTGDSTQ